MWWWIGVGVVILALFLVNYLLAWRHDDDPSAMRGRTYEGWDSEHGGGAGGL